MTFQPHKGLPLRPRNRLISRFPPVVFSPEAAMTMEFEGNLQLERAHTRRWVSIIAVIIPVGARCVAGGLVHPRLCRAANRRHSGSDDHGRGAAAARRHPAQAQIEAPPPQQPTAMAEPAVHAAGERRVPAIRAADVCDAGGRAAVARQRAAARLRRSGAGHARLVSPITITEPPPAETAALEPRPSRSPVPFRCRTPSRTAASRCSPARCRCRGRGRRTPRRRRSTCRRSTATRSITSAIPSRRRSRSAPAQNLRP